MPNLDWTFYVTWINLLLMKHKLINFDWIVNNLIVFNLLKNYLNLIKESIQKQLLIEQMFFEIGVLKNFAIFRGKHLCWSVFLIKLQACNFPRIFILTWAISEQFSRKDLKPMAFLVLVKESFTCMSAKFSEKLTYFVSGGKKS